jgi:hypothetical protein
MFKFFFESLASLGGVGFVGFGFGVGYTGSKDQGLFCSTRWRYRNIRLFG